MPASASVQELRLRSLASVKPVARNGMSTSSVLPIVAMDQVQACRATSLCCHSMGCWHMHAFLLSRADFRPCACTHVAWLQCMWDDVTLQSCLVSELYGFQAAALQPLPVSGARNVMCVNMGVCDASNGQQSLTTALTPAQMLKVAMESRSGKLGEKLLI